MMMKIVTPILVVFLVFAFTPVGSSASTTLALADTTGAHGVTTMAQILYSNPSPCAGIEMTLNYDRRQLEFLRIEPSGFLSGISNIASYEYIDGKVAIIIFDANGANCDASPVMAPFLNVYFNVNADASDGFTPLFLTDATVILPDLSYDDVQIVNGGIVPVVLTSFGGQSSAAGITLSWELDAAGFFGFFIDRRLTLSSNWSRLNEQPIVANGSPGRTSQYHYVDQAVEKEASYTYQLSAIDSAEKTIILGHATVEHLPPVPARLDISNNYPNPFNPSTRFRLDVPKAQELTVRIYDLAGRLVRELLSGSIAPGQHVIVWDGTDDGNRPTASGIYFCRMQGEGFRKTVKIMMYK